MTVEIKTKDVLVDISYCVPAMFGTSYASGSTRIWMSEVAYWLVDQLKSGKPVIVTEIREMK